MKDAIKKIFYLDELIRSKATGDKKKLAKKLDISERHLYNYLRILNEIGKTTRYDDDIQSFTYDDK